MKKIDLEYLNKYIYGIKVKNPNKYGECLMHNNSYYCRYGSDDQFVAVGEARVDKDCKIFWLNTNDIVEIDLNNVPNKLFGASNLNAPKKDYRDFYQIVKIGRNVFELIYSEEVDDDSPEFGIFQNTHSDAHYTKINWKKKKIEVKEKRKKEQVQKEMSVLINGNKPEVIQKIKDSGQNPSWIALSNWGEDKIALKKYVKKIKEAEQLQKRYVSDRLERRYGR